MRVAVAASFFFLAIGCAALAVVAVVGADDRAAELGTAMPLTAVGVVFAVAGVRHLRS